MSEFEFEREDVLPYMETGFDQKVREVVERMLREPATLPEEYKAWLVPFIETGNIQVPKTQVIGFASAEVPVGAITMYPVVTAPTGWILCDGSAVSRSDQALLFGVIGTTYGVGDGSTTFNVPNLKGRVPVGLDSAQSEFDALAETGGHKSLHAHTHTISNDGTHNHEINGGNGNFAVQVGTANTTDSVAGVTLPDTFVAATDAEGIHNHGGATGSTGSGNAQNLQPYLVVNFIIKAV